jgi:predicted PurR-regulated permease PerM
MDSGEFTKRVAIAVTIATVPFLLWYLRSVLLVAGGATLLSVVLDLLSRPLRWCRIPRAGSVGLAVLLLFGSLGATAYMFGTTLSSEMEDVLKRADIAAKTIADALQNSAWGVSLLQHVDASQLSLTSWAGNIASVSSSVFASLVVMIAMGAYMAAQPGVYRKEVRKLLPRRWASPLEAAAKHVVHSLQLWSIGQAIQMVLVGVLTTAAVWLIGLPSPLALGVIAALAEFIPYAGPFIAAVPALLVATAQGWSTLLWTLLAYIAIQQIEGNVLLPIIQRRLIAVPPAMILFSILAVSSLFGMAGVIFAAPISVMIYAALETMAPKERTAHAGSGQTQATSRHQARDHF